MILTPLTIFSDIATSFGTVLNGDSTLGGYIAGAVAVTIIAVILAIPFDEPFRMGMLGAGIGCLIVVMVGWWPVYALIFIVLLLAVLLVRLPGVSGGGARGG